MQLQKLLPYGITFLIITAVGLWLNRSYSGIPTQDIITPHYGEAVKVVYANGVVEEEQSASMASPVTTRILKLLVREGEKVKKGQQLVILDATVEEAKERSLAAKVTYLKQELHRQQTLYQRQFASQQAYQLIQSDLQQAESELQAQHNVVERLSMQAPFDGIVLRHDVSEGEVARPETPIIWIGDPKVMRITADVDEEDIPEVALGQTALIKSDAFPGQHFEAKVDAITPQGDSVAKSFRLRIYLPPETPLRSGMTVEVNVLTQHKQNALMIPSSAYYRNKVWSIDQGKIVPREVKLGIVARDQIEVLEGLDEKTTVLVNPSKYQKQLP